MQASELHVNYSDKFEEMLEDAEVMFFDDMWVDPEDAEMIDFAEEMKDMESDF